jgi:N-acetylglucosamine kinase-like BadF-type ATPase
LGKTLLNGGNGVFFLGIDGGGTKTAFLLINENGDIIEAKTIATVSYKHVGQFDCAFKRNGSRNFE